MEQVKDKQFLLDYIKTEFLSNTEIKDFNEETPLVSSRIMDSISTIQLVDFIEKEFEIEFSHHEVDQENLDSVNLMWEFIKSKKQ
ncbi:hypothetical protein [uncultured Planktosalinus sp.]|uniref:hypothetical protein n=1 Tax=uncultured Planktosalinus sp. TaxID=1810935 RepID=UPI0030DA7400